MVRRKIDALPFDIEARIPIQLGRESISNSIIAISELVKNAYDADAHKVKIKLVNDDDGQRCLIISDNGHGMDLKTIKNAWLRIGTSRKSIKDESPDGRILTGEKGLGRLGLDRLSKEIHLFSKISGSQNVTELHVNWGKFEKKHATLSELLNNVYEHDLPVNLIKKGKDYFKTKKSKGTIIKLTGLKDSWNDTYIERLHTQLTYLVSPFRKENDFEIKLEMGVKSFDGIVSSAAYLESSLLRVEAELKQAEDGKGEPIYLVDMDIQDENGALLNSIKDEPWSTFTASGPKSIPSCGPLKLEMYFFTLGVSPYFDSVPKSDTKKFMKSHYGLRIYRDEFRVLPYGEPSGKGDWLDLGRRAQGSPGGMAQGGWRVNVYQIVGAVHLKRRENPQLVDQTNREGLQENDAFHNLENFGLSVIKQFELAAHTRAKKIKTDKATSLHKAREQLSIASSKTTDSQTKLTEEIDNLKGTNAKDYSALTKIKDRAKQLELDIKTLQEASSEQERAYQEQADELRTQKDTLSNLASIGILAISFGHETVQDANTVVMYVNNLINSLKKTKHPLTDIQRKYLDRLQIKATFLKGLSKFYLDTTKTSKRIRNDIAPAQVAQNVFNALEPSLSRQNIEFKILSDIDYSVKVTAFEIDFESLFINLITNAVWALENIPKEKRYIEITLTRDTSKHKLIIEFSDSGKGISKLDEIYIFEPMFSTKKNDRGKQVGTGMGMFISKNIVEDHMNGEITVIGNGKDGGASFRIVLPISSRGRRSNCER